MKNFHQSSKTIETIFYEDLTAELGQRREKTGGEGYGPCEKWCFNSSEISVNAAKIWCPSLIIPSNTKSLPPQKELYIWMTDSPQIQFTFVGDKEVVISFEG